MCGPQHVHKHVYKRVYKSFSLSQLNEKLEETGSNTAAQIALNTRREEELAKLKMELDE